MERFILFIISYLLASHLFAQNLIITVGGGADITCPATPTATWAGSNAEISFSNWSRGTGVVCVTHATGLNGQSFNTADANASFTAQKYYRVTITVAPTASFTLSQIYWNSFINGGKTALFTLRYALNGGTVQNFGTPVTSSTGATFNGSVFIPGGSSLVLYYIPSQVDIAQRDVPWLNGSTLTFSNITLPVIWSYLDVKTQNKKNYIDFGTKTNENIAYFEIERGSEWDLFKPLGKVPAAGNSNQEQYYTFIDDRPVKGHNYYRIKSVDQDGSFRFSDIVSIRFNGSLNGVVLHPNLVHNSLKIIFESPIDHGQIHIYNLDGKLVGNYLPAKGTDELRLDVSDLISGHYVIKYLSDYGSETLRFVKE